LTPKRRTGSADSGAQRIDSAGKVEQSAIPGQLDQPTSVFGEYGIEVFGPVLAQARQRPALVATHKAGVADNVGGQSRRQFSLLTGHGNFPRLCFGSWQARARYAINGW
jgi:hypothetical protein